MLKNCWELINVSDDAATFLLLISLLIIVRCENVGSASLSSPFLRLWCLVFQPRILLFIDNSFRVYYLWCLLVVFVRMIFDLCGRPRMFIILPSTHNVNAASRWWKLHLVFFITLTPEYRAAQPEIISLKFEKSSDLFWLFWKIGDNWKKIFIEKKSLSFLVYIFPASPHPACNYCRGDSGGGGVVFPFSFSNHLLLILEKQRNWCRVLEGKEREKDPSILI